MDHIRAANVWLREFVFVLDALVLGLLAVTVVVTGMDPFDSPGLLAVTAIGLVIMAAHHLWYSRHRAEAELDRARLAGRERRGF